MHNLMSFKLFIKDDCNSCNKIIAFIKENQIDCDIFNIDYDDEPNHIKIVPALFQQNRLLAYGIDIITILKKLSYKRTEKTK